MGFSFFPPVTWDMIWIKTLNGQTLKSVLCQYLCLHRPSLLFTDLEDIVYISDSIFRTVTFWRSPRARNTYQLLCDYPKMRHTEEWRARAVGSSSCRRKSKQTKISVGKQWEPAPPNLNSQNLSYVSLEYFVYKLLFSFSTIFFIPSGQIYFSMQDLCHNSSSFLMLSAFLILFNQFTS